MQEKTPEGHDVRIARLEEENRYLRTGFDEVNRSLQKVADAITALVTDTKAREVEWQATRETISRVFLQLDANREEFTRLWRRTDEMIEKTSVAEEKRLQADLAAKGTRLAEIGKSAMYVLCCVLLAIILNHFGLK